MDTAKKMCRVDREDESVSASHRILAAGEPEQPFEAAVDDRNLPEWVQLLLCSGEWE
jgi:hypothetical protein